MKHNKIILSLVLLIISVIYVIHPYMLNKGICVDGFKDQIIRFHVKANSDMEEDQILKLIVKDAILKETSTRFGNSKSIEETRDSVKNSLDEIKAIAEDVIKDQGKDMPVHISLGLKNFPTKQYGDMVLPAGEYEALEVVLGEGKGKNWWCVMFPPLCFVDGSHGHVAKSDRDPPIVLKSKTVEVFERTKTYFARFLARE